MKFYLVADESSSTGPDGFSGVLKGYNIENMTALAGRGRVLMVGQVDLGVYYRMQEHVPVRIAPRGMDALEYYGANPGNLPDTVFVDARLSDIGYAEFKSGLEKLNGGAGAV